VGPEEYSVAVLADRGYDVTTSHAECCGMAGSLGYKEQYYDLSMDVGEYLEGRLRAADADHVVASGTRTDRIGDLLGAQPRHRSNCSPRRSAGPRSPRADGPGLPVGNWPAPVWLSPTPTFKSSRSTVRGHPEGKDER